MMFSSLRSIDAFSWMGIFFAIAQGFIFSAVLFDHSLAMYLFWSCNNFCIFLVYACYKKDMQMLMGISYLGLVSQILWVLDLISHTVGYNLSGVSDYIFLEGFTYANEVSIGIHLLIPISVLIFSFRVRPNYRSLKFTIPYILLIYVTTLLFTPYFEDINCVFLGCNNTFIPYNIYLWPLYALVSSLISLGIHVVLYFVSKKVSSNALFMLLKKF